MLHEETKYAVGDKDKGIYLVEYANHRIPMFADPKSALLFDTWEEARDALQALDRGGFKVPPGLRILAVRWELVIGDAHGRRK